MAFESFLNKPYDEYELLLQVAEEVKNNFAQIYGKYYFLHLTKVDDKTSKLEKIKLFVAGDSPGVYIHIEHSNMAGIMISIKKNMLVMLVNGEHVYAEVSVTPTSVTVTYGPTRALLPINRKAGITPMDFIRGFCDIGDSLLQVKRNKAN